jgi:protein-S-isoprenylcysteine O-methyltransferase Ste14
VTDPAQSAPKAKSAKSAAQRPALAIKLGSLTLSGPSATAAALIIVGLLVALIIWSKPSLGMWLSGGMWLAFIVFWSVTAQKRTGSRVEESTQSRATHQNLLNLGLLLLFLPIPGLRWRFLPQSPVLVPAGLAVQVAAALLHVWARRHLGRNWSSPVMIQADHRLVRSGPYALVRHPIYTAILGLAAGTAMVAGELHSLLGVAAIAVAYARKIRLEERFLGETYGVEWDSYKKASRALIPWLF